jgi:hypothetical protein
MLKAPWRTQALPNWLHGRGSGRCCFMMSLEMGTPRLCEQARRQSVGAPYVKLFSLRLVSGP